MLETQTECAVVRLKMDIMSGTNLTHLIRLNIPSLKHGGDSFMMWGGDTGLIYVFFISVHFLKTFSKQSFEKRMEKNSEKIRKETCV